MQQINYCNQVNIAECFSSVIIVKLKKSTKMSDLGYKKSRFPNLHGQIFDCILCKQVVKSPKECSGCGNLFCETCINQFIKTHQSCPNSCAASSIVKMSARALIQIYNDLDIKCLTCPKTLKLGDLQKHQQVCGRSKCTFNDMCDQYQTKGEAFSPFCSEKCQLLSKILEAKADNKIIYDLLKKYNPKPVTLSPTKSSSLTSGGLLQLKWSPRQSGMNIIIGNEQTSVFLKEEAYVFRTVLANQAFMGGRHYWEIHADNRTDNQLKIGVVSGNSFDFNTAFCDHKIGFAYYGLGQLRHGSNATGQQYGKRFKKVGVLGIFLNMDKGTLSFCLNGQDMGQAYNDPELKKGPLYPAVALLHCSGCVLKGEIPIPQIYMSK